jgi:hypothetical protein
MAVNNPRNRVLIFRLTQDEYAALQTASAAHGARSLSDYARGKLLAAGHGPAAIERQLAELGTNVARIAGLLENGSFAPPLARAVRNGSPELIAPKLVAMDKH